MPAIALRSSYHSGANGDITAHHVQDLVTVSARCRGALCMLVSHCGAQRIAAMSLPHPLMLVPRSTAASSSSSTGLPRSAGSRSDSRPLLDRGVDAQGLHVAAYLRKCAQAGRRTCRVAGHSCRNGSGACTRAAHLCSLWVCCPALKTLVLVVCPPWSGRSCTFIIP